MRLLLNSLLATFVLTHPGFAAEIPESAINTQKETHPLLAPDEALSRMKLPAGFRATVFAAEPEIRQPIAMTFDGRGRLWVAENDTYSDRETDYDLSQSDRVIILHDENGDGTADSRKVFWDKGHHLTSVELGFGGVWVLCAPDLLFIPDHDQDDIPDGEPTVMLTGFNNSSIRHNIVNGLKWGPDGWLYGRHGITTTSFVGLPETPEELRTPLNCSMWRFHPVTKEFEVITNGTTNSWGHDWDEHGELFFINTVIGHFWHAVPGAHFERMFGEDFNPHLYQLMPQTADHYHWDTNEAWSDVRKSGVTATTDAAGGGHAHCGMMIYQGNNWPEEYRGDVFTLNLHGLRINREDLQRKGAGFNASHHPDFALTSDLWFRGVELSHGPDGEVYVLDWSDIGECHENDGIHRTSGRIYKIGYGKPQPYKNIDYAKLSDGELIEQLKNDDAWHHRMARKHLQERHVAQKLSEKTRDKLKDLLASADTTTLRLRALWALHGTGGVNQETLLSLIKEPQESLRVWAVKLLSEQMDAQPLADVLQSQAQADTSGLVLLHIASALRKLPLDVRLPVGEKLLQHKEFAEDKHLPLMIWYGIEPAVAEQSDQAVSLLAKSQMPLVNQFIARRLAAEYRVNPGATEAVLDFAAQANAATATKIIHGIQQAFDGWRKADAPKNWQHLAVALKEKNNRELSERVEQLSVIFGDGLAMERLREIAKDGKEPTSSRRNAIRALVTSRDNQTQKLLKELLKERDLAIDAIRGLAVIGDEQTPHVIAGFYKAFRGHVRPIAIETLASRPEFAQVLLISIEEGRIPIEEVSPFYVRQMRTFDDAELQERLQKLFPEWRHTSQEKEERVNSLQELLTEARVAKATPTHGRQIFEKTCSACHKLYGKGGTLGPDLTGSQRSNLNYLLGNIVDPSAEVAEKFQMSIIVLEDGRSVSGVIQRENDETLVIQTPNETLTLLQDDIIARKNSKLSMMPERQLDKMSEQEILDLFAFLMSKGPVQ